MAHPAGQFWKGYSKSRAGGDVRRSGFPSQRVGSGSHEEP